MRRLRYQVAASLDGYIADDRDGFDWIVADPDIDFGELMAQYDTLLMGRRTFEVAGGLLPADVEVVVCSRTLRQEDHPGVRILSEGVADAVRQMKRLPGRDIWLYGGGDLFRQLLEAGVVDTVEPAIIPVLLGSGVPLLPGGTLQRRLRLSAQRLYEKSGIVLIQYDVAG
jgi:dihydrofolate reductase